MRFVVASLAVWSASGAPIATCDAQARCIDIFTTKETVQTSEEDVTGGCNDDGDSCFFEACIDNSFFLNGCLKDEDEAFSHSCPKFFPFSNQCQVASRGFGVATLVENDDDRLILGNTGIQCQWGRPGQTLEFIYKDGNNQNNNPPGCVADGSDVFRYTPPGPNNFLNGATVQCRDESTVADEIDGWEDCAGSRGECVWEITLPNTCGDSMAGDPVVVAKDGHKTHFWLPLGKWISIFQVEDYVLLARSFGRAGTHQQWIDGIALMHGDELVFDAVVSHENRTITTKLDGKRISPISSLASSSRKSPSVSLEFGQHHSQFSHIIGGYDTQINLHTPFFHLKAFLMPAIKYADLEDAAKYAHIDWQFLNFEDTHRCSGLACDLMFGKTTVDPELMANYTKKPTKIDVERLDFENAQPPEFLANKSQVVFS